MLGPYQVAQAAHCQLGDWRSQAKRARRAVPLPGKSVCDMPCPTGQSTLGRNSRIALGVLEGPKARRSESQRARRATADLRRAVPLPGKMPNHQSPILSQKRGENVARERRLTKEFSSARRLFQGLKPRPPKKTGLRRSAAPGYCAIQENGAPRSRNGHGLPRRICDVPCPYPEKAKRRTADPSPPFARNVQPGSG